MARQIARTLTRGPSQGVTPRKETTWSASFDTAMERWRDYERTMAAARLSKDGPLQWQAPIWKREDAEADIPPPEKVESEKVRGSTKVLSKASVQKEEAVDDNKPDLDQSMKEYQDEMDSQREVIRRRLERVAQRGRYLKIEKHSMINPQKLFTPAKKLVFGPDKGKFTYSTGANGPFWNDEPLVTATESNGVPAGKPPQPVEKPPQPVVNYPQPVVNYPQPVARASNIAMNYTSDPSYSNKVEQESNQTVSNSNTAQNRMRKEPSKGEARHTFIEPAFTTSINRKMDIAVPSLSSSGPISKV